MRFPHLDTPEFRYLKKWSIISLLIGGLSGLGAVAFYELLNFCTELFLGWAGFFPPEAGMSRDGALGWSPPGSPLLIVLILTLGGLVSGLIVFTLAPEARGAGVDAAIRSFHKQRGEVRRRIPPLKMLASVLIISTGGSAGSQGPIAQITAGFGSFVGESFRLDEHDRRMALAVGMGSGVGAIFKAPLGGALLSTEILYREDLEKEALIPSVIACVVGYTIFGFYDGFTPIFAARSYPWSIEQIPLYMLLGAACAAAGILYIKSFYSTKALFARLGIKDHYKPAIGAFLVGVLVLLLMGAFPEARGTAGLGALSVGYGFIQLAIYNTLPLEVMFVLIFAKIATTSLTVGSGGSGGVFAPGLVIGAMVGGTLGTAFSELLPSLVPGETVPAFIIIGMMALFGGVSNAPIAVLLMVSEMTGDYSLLLPAMVAIVGSYLLTSHYSIYEEQVPTRLHSPAHLEEYFCSLLTVPSVEQVMRRELPSARREESLKEIVLKMRHGISTVPVAEGGEIEGVVRLGDIARVPSARWSETKAREVMSRDFFTLTGDKNLYEAISLMKERGAATALVVSRDDPRKIEGLLLERDLVKLMGRTR